MSGAHMLQLTTTLDWHRSRLPSMSASFRPQLHWRILRDAPRCKPGSMLIIATSTDNQGSKQQESPGQGQHHESYAYQAGWKNLSRVSSMLMRTRVQCNPEDPVEPDQYARIQISAGNGVFGGVDGLQNDGSQNILSKVSSFLCRGLATCTALLCIAMLLNNGGSQLPQLWTSSLGFVGTFKGGPSMAGLASTQRTANRLGCLAESMMSKPQPLGLNVSPPNFTNMSWSLTRLSYMLDVLLEQHPISYVLLLTMACLTLIIVGGVFFYNYRRNKPTLGDAMWDAWACVCASSTHLKERTRQERTIGIMLAFGGLLFYSLLTSTMTAQIKSRMDWLREGAHSQVMESGHIVICGANNHLSTVLQQLNRSQEFAIRDGTAVTRKQTVLLLSERARRDTEKLVSNVVKDCTEINILTRSGSLSSTRSFQKVAAGKARSVIFLANKDDTYEADADAVLSVLALQPTLDEGFSGNVIVEVSKKSTADLLKSLSDLKVSSVQNLSSKLFVQCSRQRGLIDVYRQLLDHGKAVINLRNYPSLAGLAYGEVRRGFPEAVVCGLMQAGGGPEFHPKDYQLLQETDKLLIIAAKHTHREPPRPLVATADKYRKMMAMLEASPFDMLNTPAVYDAVLSKQLDHTAKKVPKLASKTAAWTAARRERIIILGWRPGVSEMVREYEDYVGPGSELVILAEAPLEERMITMNRRISSPLRNIHVVHKIGNPMSRTDLRNAILDRGSPAGLKVSGMARGTLPERSEKLPLSIVVIADKGWHVGDTSKPDKQSVFALLLAEALCKEQNVKVTSLVAEFVDTKLGKQVVKSHRSLTYIGTSELMGLVTSQVIEHGELNSVWTELLNSWGNEIYVKGIELYMKSGETPSFEVLSERAILRDEVAIGYKKGKKVVLNPSIKHAPLVLTPGEDSLVVISEFE